MPPPPCPPVGVTPKSLTLPPSLGPAYWEVGQRRGGFPRRPPPCPSPPGAAGKEQRPAGSVLSWSLGQGGLARDKRELWWAPSGSPEGHNPLGVLRSSSHCSPCPPGLTMVNTPTKGLSDTWEQPSLRTASAPLGPGRHEAFQNTQTPGQGRARAWGGIPHTAAGCTTGQVPTCLRGVARTCRPSGWRTLRGQRPVLPPPLAGGRGLSLPSL